MDSERSLPCSQELAPNSSHSSYLGQYPTARKHLYIELLLPAYKTTILSLIYHLKTVDGMSPCNHTQSQTD